MKVFKPKEAAEYLNISLDYLKKLLITGKIKGFRLSNSKQGHWRIVEEELLKFINKKAF